MNRESLFCRRWIWAVLGMGAVGLCVLSFLLYPKALPLLSLEISMDHTAALARAREVAASEGWGPKDFRQVAQFIEQSKLRRYVELEGGGADAFRALVGQKWAATHTWTVRHYRPNEQEEALIYFFPDGERAGFWRFFPESWPGEVLGEEAARQVAEEAAVKSWGMKREEWKLVEHGEQNQPGGRRDHRFVYEHAAQKPGEGVFRWRLDVSGDQLTASYRFSQIPESFSNRYMAQRSSNESLAEMAGSVLALVYGGGAFVALVLLGRKGWLAWKPAIVLAGVLALLAAADFWSTLPSIWFDYETSVDEADFRWNLFMERGGALLFGTLGVALLVCLGESISRRCFAHHPQLWKSWAPGVVSSSGIFGRTLGGYLLSTLDLSYMVAFYLVATQLWGWWCPVFSIADPNILAMRLPWAAPLFNALRAGILEECLFRALPLSAAILLGRWLRREQLCVVLGLVFQALVFSAAHANYESFPAYCRLVELFVPSLVAGILFLRWGLIPVILTHFLYDAVLMNLPLFAMRVEGAWVHQAIALLAMGTPLAVVAFARARASAPGPIPQAALNAAWSPKVSSVKKDAPAPRPRRLQRPQRLIPEGVQWGVAAVCAALLVSLIFFKASRPQLALDRGEAIQKAREFLSLNGIRLDADWRARAQVVNTTRSREEMQLVEKNTAAAIRAVEEYLPRPQWSVDFSRFTGDVADRGLRYVVRFSGDGKKQWLIRFLPESSEGASLHEACAREIALGDLQRTVEAPVHLFEEVSSIPEKLPARTDWTFVFRDTRPSLAEGFEARVSVKIAGEQPVQTFGFIHLSEQILVEHTNRLASAKKLVSFIDALGALMLMVCVIHAGVCAARGEWNWGLFRSLLLPLIPLIFWNHINGWPEAEAAFDVLKPLNHQWFGFVSTCFQGTLGIVGMGCLQAGVVYHTPNLSQIPVRRIVLGAVTMALVTRVTFLGFVRGFDGGSTSAGDFVAAHSWIVSLHGLSVVTQITSAFGILAYIAWITSRIAGGFRLGWIWELLFVFGLLLYFLSSNPTVTSSLPTYLHSALIYALPISFGFRFLMGRCPEGVPLVVCALCGIASFEDFWAPVVSGQRAGSLVAIATAAAFSVAWVYWIKRQRGRSDGLVPPFSGEPGGPEQSLESGIFAPANPTAGDQPCG